MYIKLRHIGIVVNNLNKNINFFKKYFGFRVFNNQLEKGNTISSILKIKNLRVRTVKMVGRDGNKIELLKFYDKNQKIKKKKIYEVGITHFAISVKNVDKIYSNFKKDKIKFLNKPKVSDDKKVKVFFCKTPENVYLELVEEINA